MEDLENNEIESNELADNEMTANELVDSETENVVQEDVDPEPTPEPEEFHDYQLTPEDIAKGYKLLPNFDDIVDDGTIEKPYAIFKDSEIQTIKLPWNQFEIDSETFYAGDEVRKEQGYRCHYSGRYMVRKEWVSGYTAKEYMALFKYFDAQARENDYCIDEWRGQIKAQKLSDVANDHYNLKTKEEQEAWDKEQAIRRKQERITELKGFLLDTDYVWNVIKEGDADESYYAETLANRKSWRAEIRELEKELEGDNTPIEEKEKQEG